MRRSALIAWMLAACGCGSDGHVVPVSGIVTLDGRPLPGVIVLFQPIAMTGEPGSGSLGRTGADGHFTLRQIQPDRDGAVVGRHQVRITTSSTTEIDEASGPGVEPLPSRYHRQSTLTYDVPSGGTRSADFSLTSR